MPYRVTDWDEHFENYKSRERDRCGFVSIPNDHGSGMGVVLSEPDGAAIFGIFILIVEMCSRQLRPRRGWLTVHGKPSDYAYTADDLAIPFRRPAQEIKRAFEILTTDRVGWMQWVELAAVTSTRRVPVAHPPRTLYVSKEGKEGSKEECSEPADASSLPPAPEFHPDEGTQPPTRLSKSDARRLASPEPANGETGTDTPDVPPKFPVFPCRRGKANAAVRWELVDSLLTEFQTTYRGVDVAQACREAWQWCAVECPEKRKTAAGMKAFLQRWLQREARTLRRRQRAPAVTPVGQFATKQQRYTPG
jgi:hypothetical protein